MSVSIGVTTFNRPEYLRKCLRAIQQYVAPLCDSIYIHNDGSDKKFHAEYQRAYARLPGAIIQDSPVNEGVAKSKNHLLRSMLESGSTWLLLCEDDILVKSPEAVTAYVAACEDSGLDHLSFALHGPANQGGPVRADDTLAYYPHSIGAWCIYSRRCLEDVGLFNENLHNAWEHVELSLRLARAGYTTGAYEYADVVHSERFLTEIPGSIEKSSIRPRSDWQSSIRNGLQYWAENMPDTFDDLFGEGKPLHQYAMSIIG